MNNSKFYLTLLIVSLTLFLYSCDTVTDSAQQNEIQSQGLVIDSDAKKAKVEVCHLDDEGNFKLISIAEPALGAHENHGDVQPLLDGTCPPSIPDCFDGVYSGSFNQTNVPTASVSVTFLGCVSPGEKIADVAYSVAFNCSGDWILVEDTESGLLVEEVNMTSGCVNNIGIALEYDILSGNLNGETVTYLGNPIPLGLYGTYDDLQQVP